MTWWEVVRLVGLFGTLTADVTFIALMHAWVAWRGNPWGRHVMVFSYALAAILVAGLAALVFGDYPGRPQVLSVLYVGLAAALWQRVYLTVREHRRSRAGRRRTSVGATLSGEIPPDFDG
jgi:hypothetical protein